MFFHAENYEIKIKFVFNCVQKRNINYMYIIKYSKKVSGTMFYTLYFLSYCLQGKKKETENELIFNDAVFSHCFSFTN